MRDYIEELNQIIGPVWTALIMFSTAFIIAIIAVFALVCVGVGVEVLMDKRKKRKQAERVKRYWEEEAKKSEWQREVQKDEIPF